MQIANTTDQTVEQLQCQLNAERKLYHQLVDENIQLGKELEQARLELKLERQNKFATNQQKNADPEVDVASSPEKNEKKKGAPIGHPGWFRPTPTEFDWSILVNGRDKFASRHSFSNI